MKEHNYIDYQKLGDKVNKEIYGENIKNKPSVEQIEEDYWKICEDDSQSKI